MKKKPLVAVDLISFTEAEDYHITTGAEKVAIKSLRTFQFEDRNFYFLLSDFKNEGKRTLIYNKSIGANTVDDRRTVIAKSQLGKILKGHGISLKGGANFIRVDASILKGNVVRK